MLSVHIYNKITQEKRCGLNPVLGKSAASMNYSTVVQRKHRNAAAERYESTMCGKWLQSCDECKPYLLMAVLFSDLPLRERVGRARGGRKTRRFHWTTIEIAARQFTFLITWTENILMGREEENVFPSVPSCASGFQPRPSASAVGGDRGRCDSLLIGQMYCHNKATLRWFF